LPKKFAKVNPALVLPDKEGKPYSVRYDAVNAMLLKEFLKEHQAFVEQQCKVQEQEAIIAELRRDLQVNLTRQQKQIETLTASLQRVSAELEVRKSAPQMVLNAP
jgi:septal ring factor EnvC (AmiA/AmiB activator)